MSKRKKRRPGGTKRNSNRPRLRKSPLQKKVDRILRWRGWFWIFVVITFLVAIGLAILLIHLVFRWLFGQFLQKDPASIGWLVVFLATSALSLYAAWRRRWFDCLLGYTEPKRFGKARKVILGGAIVLFINALLVFMVAPWAMHQIMAEPSQVVVKITDLDPVGGYRECDPKIQVDLFGGSWFCTNWNFYNRVQRGDRLLLEGRKSDYGFSLYHYRRAGR